MNDKIISINQWIKNFDNKEYDKDDKLTQINAGWYDWFCEDHELNYKTQQLADKVKQLAKSPKVNTDKWCVCFKNNCPMEGDLYDDFRFADIKNHKVMYTIIPTTGYEGHYSEVWGHENDFEKPLVEGTWKDVTKFFEVK